VAELSTVMVVSQPTTSKGSELLLQPLILLLSKFLMHARWHQTEVRLVKHQVKVLVTLQIILESRKK